MNFNSIKLGKAIIPMLFIASTYSYAESKYTTNEIDLCPVNPEWVTNPSMPLEVKKSGIDGDSNFCDFYQFTTQAFFYLMSQPTNSSPYVFQNDDDYPALEFETVGTSSNPADSCDGKITGVTYRMAVNKSPGDSSLSTGQAGGGATIYDQNGNVVYYESRFNKELCNLSSSAVELGEEGIKNFPSGTTEIKLAWKTLGTGDDIASYITRTNPINGKAVGLVGMHMVIATEDHPEFIWSTFEHKHNAPDCNTTNEDATTWNFTSESCAAGLPNNVAKNSVSCNFNNPLTHQTSSTGKPTNICRAFPFGTDASDYKADENLLAIASQNIGAKALIQENSAKLGYLKPLENYFLVGALWVSDIKKNSGGVGVPNERGSLRLANTTAETAHQNVDINSNFASNCFGCHNYKGTVADTGYNPTNNITSQDLSHMFTDIKLGQGRAVDITSRSQINSQADAVKACPATCSGADSLLTWNGNWTNINPDAGSVCGCVLKN